MTTDGKTTFAARPGLWIDRARKGGGPAFLVGDIDRLYRTREG